jgi:hypothetical protein
MGTITPDERALVRAQSPIGIKYDTPLNRESAYEILNRRALEKIERPETRGKEVKAEKPAEKRQGMLGNILWGTNRRQGMVETMAKQAVRTVGSQLGRQIVRGILGGIFGGKGGR